MPMRVSLSVALFVTASLTLTGQAFAKIVESDGYKYVQLSLADLWTGFFVFMLSIVFVLIGLFLFFTWRKVLRDRAAGVPQADAGAEDDGTVF